MRLPAIDDHELYTGLDRFGRVDDQWYLNTSTSTTLDRLQYGYDRDGNVLYQKNLVNASFSELYHANSATSGDNNSAYDPLSRLTAFRRGTLTSSGDNGTGLDTITTANLNSTTSVPNQNSWSLDALGNWTSGAGLSNSFNSQNEETSNGSNTLTYDHNGDMTTDQAGNLYTFDAWGHVIRIANSSNSTEETFSYDALGRAVVNNNGSGTENRYYSGGNIIQEQFSSTNYAQYVYGLAYVNDVILRDRNADGNNSTGNLGITGSGLEEREYAQHDTQFSTISLTDSTGAVMQRFIYDPYGTITVLTPTWTVDGTGGGTNYWLYTFQGMRIVDAPGTSGMLFSETRIYDAALGRWISQDPAGYVDGTDRYEFELANPPGNLDPYGLCCEAEKQNLSNAQQAVRNANLILISFQLALANTQTGVTNSAAIANAASGVANASANSTVSNVATTGAGVVAIVGSAAKINVIGVVASTGWTLWSAWGVGQAAIGMDRDNKAANAAASATKAALQKTATEVAAVDLAQANVAAAKDNENKAIEALRDCEKANGG